ncbi:hypothetical protein PGTUg99_025230 [Puccinia graminis f. sp. tritici]|uniref:Uncharacterized protein n=1 Tax=Puccinia graminis f. sp. tritici TaxID=56615 RepID=A0A5B0SIM3_PUCGR|nr:hypothetical protein PGTUg99_025230 [Puccinia graminis f. sp. tritici]
MSPPSNTTHLIRLSCWWEGDDGNWKEEFAQRPESPSRDFRVNSSAANKCFRPLRPGVKT